MLQEAHQGLNLHVSRLTAKKAQIRQLNSKAKRLREIEAEEKFVQQ